MRIRTIKPEFWTHRMHKVLSEPAALLACGMICYPDDEGRFEFDLEDINRQLFPKRPLSKPLREAMEELVRVGFIRLYQGRVDGEVLELGQVVNFRRHQSINKFTQSRYPSAPKNAGSESAPGTLPEDYGSDTGAIREREDSDTTTGGLREDSRGKEGKERKGKDRKEGAPEARNGCVLIEDLEGCLRIAAQKNIAPECAEKWFLDLSAVGWVDERLRPIENRLSSLLAYAKGWERNEKNGPPRMEPGDAAEWWTMPASYLEDLSMSLAMAGEKGTAQRVQAILKQRRGR